MKFDFSASHSLRRNLLLALFVLAAFVRLVPSLYNVQSNDDHLEVIHRLQQGQPTRIADCWQCYHPKLYHHTGRLLLQLTGTTNPGDQFRDLNLFNAAAGLVGLWALWKLLALSGLAWGVRYLVLALLAVNGLVVRTQTMATNEAFAGVWALLAFWQVARLWKWRKPSAALWALGFCLVAVLNKGTGLVVSLATVLTLIGFVINQWRTPARRNFVLAGLLGFAVLLPVSMFTLGSYGDNLKDRGSILAVNSPTVKFPHLWKPSMEEPAGVISLTHFFLRTEFLDLLEHPFLIHGHHREYPAHRANFWATLYAEFWYSRYPWFPSNNVANDPQMIWAARLFYLSGLLPTAVLLFGWLWVSWRLLRQFRRQGRHILRFLTLWRLWLPWMIATGFLAMLAKFSLDYRAYNFVKTIYMLPGLAGFAWLTAHGLQTLLRTTHRFPRITWGILALWWTAIGAATLDSLYFGREHALNRARMNAWNENKQHQPDLPSGALRLETLPIDWSQQDWGDPKINANIIGQPLRLDGQRFWNGLGMHAKGEVHFTLPPGYSELHTLYGICDSGIESIGMRFEIEVDGQVQHRSSIVTPRILRETRVDITDAQKLILRVLPVGSSYADHGCWFEPVLLQ